MTKRRAETRAKLLESAFRVFADKGFGMVRIDDVCSAAGYTRGAFYSQFESLDELFFTLYDERAQVIAAQIADALLLEADATDVDMAIEKVSATLLLDRDWLLIKTDFLLHAARHPDIAERLAAHRAQLREVVEQRLRAVGDQLSLPKSIGSIPDAARAVVAAYDGVTVQLLVDRDLAAARRWLTQLLTTLLNR
ncbi:TetR/AcrR family transcriptional regulator [Mycobacterium yunnanensis]|uniref:TetR/AcrR family transcriptional regulator n=1 Tax=Mycobacterium yunnanensis TaxID=368477 RepID=UPI0021F379A8|nr:TetR/AcrR family transcriptional regulator [Mycobacterium yunnanensis]